MNKAKRKALIQAAERIPECIEVKPGHVVGVHLFTAKRGQKR